MAEAAESGTEPRDKLHSAPSAMFWKPAELIQWSTPLATKNLSSRHTYTQRQGATSLRYTNHDDGIAEPAQNIRFGPHLGTGTLRLPPGVLPLRHLRHLLCHDRPPQLAQEKSSDRSDWARAGRCGWGVVVSQVPSLRRGLRSLPSITDAEPHVLLFAQSPRRWCRRLFHLSQHRRFNRN